MHTTINYAGEVDAERRAVVDAIQYLGVRRSKVVFRALRDARTFADIDNISNALSLFAGVEGYPVRMMIARVRGQGVLDAWTKAADGSTDAIVEGR